MSTIKERQDGYGMFLVALILAAAALMLGTACSDSDGGTTVVQPVTTNITAGASQTIRINAGRDVYFVLGDGLIVGPFTEQEADEVEAEAEAEEPAEVEP